jgi:hypothetical protein
MLAIGSGRLGRTLRLLLLGSLLSALAVLGCDEDDGDGNASLDESGGQSDGGQSPGSAPAGSTSRAGTAQNGGDGGGTSEGGATSDAGRATDGGAGGENPAGGGAAGAIADGGQGGAAGDDSCVERRLLGTYAMQMHNEVKLCFKSDFHCAEEQTKVEDASATFSLYVQRDEPGIVQGEFHGPGITLGPFSADDEIWDTSLFFHYPKAGEPVDILDDYQPQAGTWDPGYTGSWVRVIADLCYTESDVGWVHIDIDLKSGRVIDYARKCIDDYETLWYEYRLSGSGSLACELEACNDLENTAVAAEIVDTPELDQMTGGEIATGSYQLAAVHYYFPPESTAPCYAKPSSIRETLAVAASSASTGTIEMISERGVEQPIRSTLTYQLDGPSHGFTSRWACGEETLTFQLVSAASYTATEDQLVLQLPIADCTGIGFATYIYEKQ